MTLAPSTAFAGYYIEAEIGRGGMGVVYRAVDTRLDRPVALKLVAPELAGDPRFRERFLRESRLAAAIDHGNVLPIYEAGEHEGQLFLAMRFVQGSDLKALLREQKTLPAEQALSILGRVADALDAAHARGLVHRDVKPANVLLDERGHPYLSDFGLTKEADGTSTQTGHIVGTLGYLAPEQIRGEEIDGRTDEYALTCLLHECLAGTPPFSRPTEAEVLWAHMQEDPPTLRGYEALDPVLARGLAKDKTDRYPTCGELLAAAHSAVGLEPPALRRRRRRRGLKLVLAGGALLVAAGIAAAVIEFTGGSGAAALQVDPDSVGVVDADSSRVIGQIAVPGRPSVIAADGNTIWIASEAARTLSAISAATRSVRRVVALNFAATDLAADGNGAVWALDGAARRVAKIDSTYGSVVRRVRLPDAAGAGADSDVGRVRIDARGDAVWVTDGGSRLLQVDPQSGSIRRRVDLGFSLTDVAVDGDSVWALSGAAATLFRLDPQGTLTDRIPMVSRPGLTGPFPVAISLGGGAVWVLNANRATVTRIDPMVGGVAATIPLGVYRSPSSIAAGAGAVWVANADGTLARIDSSTNGVSSTFIGGAPIGVAVSSAKVWVSVQPGARLKADLPHLEGQLDPGVSALPTSYCSPVFHGGMGKPDYLIVSDLPFQGFANIQETLQMADAIRFVIAEHGFKAGGYSIGYQSCDDSSAQTGGWTAQTCRRNAKAYAQQANVLGVIGTFNSGCSLVEIPILEAASRGPMPMVGAANTYVGLTRAGPGTEAGEPEKYYPRGIRNFVRVIAADDIQGAANAVAAKRLGVSKVYVLDDKSAYGRGIAESFRRAATKLRIKLVGSESWDIHARSYAALARRIKAARADGIFLAGIIDLNGPALLRGLRAGLGDDVHIMAPDGFTPISLLTQLAGPAAEGMSVSFPAITPSRLPAAGRRFVAEFGNVVAGPVAEFSVTAAQATEVLLDAIARSNGTRASVVGEMFKVKVRNGLLGSFAFDPNGDTTAGAVTILRVEKGKEKVFAVITPTASLLRN